MTSTISAVPVPAGVGTEPPRRSPQASIDASLLEHAWLAERLARRASRHRGDLDELRQVAMIGLWQATRRFDPGRGVSFATFAHATIDGELKRHRRDTNWTMRLPRSVHDSYFRVSSFIGPLTQRLGRSPTIAEIAEFAGVPDETVMLALEVDRSGHLDSIDASHDAVGDADDSLAVDDDHADAALNRVALSTLMQALTDREREVVGLRFFRDLPQREIGRRIGCSQMQVSRILTRALDRLRSACEG